VVDVVNGLAEGGMPSKLEKNVSQTMFSPILLQGKRALQVIRDLQPHNCKGNELKHEQESECRTIGQTYRH